MAHTVVYRAEKVPQRGQQDTALTILDYIKPADVLDNTIKAGATKVIVAK